jgi:adenylate cyclase
MPDLLLDLFGSPRLRLQGAPIEIRSQKALALLIYLAVEGGPHRRDFLAGLLWPDYSQQAARTYLRQALHELAHTVGHHHFEAGRETIGLAAHSVQTDVGDFGALLAKGSHAPDALRQAVALYTNDFLAGFSLPDCPEFEQWQLLQAESLCRQLADGLQEVMRGYIDEQAYAAASAMGQRWLALDRCDEAAHRGLMQLYAWMGRPSAALRQYEECKRALREQLQSAPDPETEALVEAIRSKRLPPAPHSLSAAREAASPLPSPAPAGDLPPRAATFVGRERELAQLAGAMTGARRGSGQFIFVIGGAGRGKTTLVQEFARTAQAEDGDLLVASGTCSAYTGIGDPYLPFRQILMALAGDGEATANGEEDARRLWQALPAILPVLVEDAPDLLRAFVPLDRLQRRAENIAPAHLPWRQRLQGLAKGDERLQLEERQLFSQFSGALKAIAAHHPLLLILEDLHWVDAASNSLLLHLSRSLGASPILVVGTYRPDELNSHRSGERHPLAAILGEVKRNYGDIWLDLAALPEGEGRAFVDAYLDTQPNRLDEQFRATLFHHTQGHALFTVELVRDLQERGDLRRDADGSWVAGERVNWSMLPARVEGVIEQRIGRLEPSLQAMLAAASVEGELFTAEVIARVRRLEGYEVVQQLSQELDRQQRLVRIEAMEQVGGQRLSRYRFRHYLFQHYLYSRLTPSERAYLHEKVGGALEELYFGENAGEDSREGTGVTVQLAHHFEQAGLAEKAVAYLRQGGEQAQRISAHREAIQLLTRALDLLATLPATSEHLKQELAIRLVLGKALIPIKGIGSPESAEMYRLAYTLCEKVGNVDDLFESLWGLYSTGRNAEINLSVAVQLLKVADSQPNIVYRISAHHIIGRALVETGDFGAALKHFEQCLAFYEPRHHQALLSLCGQDEGIAAMANRSALLWHLGFPDQALKQIEEAVALAEELDHPISVTIAKHFAIFIHLSRGEAEIAHPKIDALLEVGQKQEFGFVVAVCARYRGMGFIRQGKLAEGIAHLEASITGARTTGGAGSLPSMQLMLAQAYSRSGQFDRAQTLFDEAAAAIGTNSEFIIFMNQVKGEMLLAQALHLQHSSNGFNGVSRMDEAEAAFIRAIQCARQQRAKSLELRVTLSLCRLWQHQGKNEEARRLLAAIYGWFTEGLETADLLEAKALLGELSAGTRHLTV